MSVAFNTLLNLYQTICSHSSMAQDVGDRIRFKECIVSFAAPLHAALGAIPLETTARWCGYYDGNRVWLAIKVFTLSRDWSERLIVGPKIGASTCVFFSTSLQLVLFFRVTTEEAEIWEQEV